MTRVTLPRFVRIPTSELGHDGVIGEIMSSWTDTISVRFANGRLGQYRILRHQILDASEDVIIWYLAVYMIIQETFGEQN